MASPPSWLRRLCAQAGYCACVAVPKGFPGHTVQRDAGLAFLAQQVPTLHVGGKTALDWRGVRHNLAFRETVVLWGDQPARLPRWLDGDVRVRYRVAHIFDPELPAGLGRAPLAVGHPELPVSAP